MSDCAIAYAESVTRGDIVACLYVRQACQRFLNEIADESFGYRYDTGLARRFCAFFPAALRHYKGKHARTARSAVFELDGWQHFIVSNLFGWVDKQTGLRRFRKAFISVAKKNGKSAMVAGIGLALLVLDDEPTPEIYAAATQLAQAKMVLEPAQSFAKNSPSERLRRLKHLTAPVAALKYTDRNGIFMAVSKSPPDGFNVSAAIIDEFHEHPNNDVIDIIEQGTVGREQPLTLIITTAGYNQVGPCKQEWDYCAQLMSGTMRNEQYFAYVATLDDGDDWRDRATWAKANPGLGTIKPHDTMMSQFNGIHSSEYEQRFKVKQLNLWVSGAIKWIDLEEWDKCA